VSRWQYIVGPAAGGREWSLTEAKGRKLNAKLTAPSEAALTINGRDPLAARVEELRTDLHVLRRDDDGQSRALFRGRIGPTGDVVDETSHTVTVRALDYRAVLARRMLWSNSQLAWAGADQAAIAWGLVQQTQIRPGGPLGIVRGLGQTTGIMRDRTYEAGDSIGDKIQELSEVVDAFDWDVTPTSSWQLDLDLWHPQRGEDRSVVLQHGGALVASVSRDIDPAEYANAVRGSGSAPEGGGAEPPPVEREAADIASRTEGRWDRATGHTGITTTPALVDRTDWQLAESEVIQPSYTVKLRRGAWRGPGHIWLGDTVRLIVMSGRLRVDARLRVQEFDITPSDDAEDEDVALTVGAPKRDYRRRATALERRLADLERR
jgi:hypothetical protein